MEFADPNDSGEGANSTVLESTLLSFYLDMTRGMSEFRRAYGLDAAGEPPPPRTPGDLARELSTEAEAGPAWRELRSGLQDLKVHHAALLEAYNEAAQTGSRRLLDSLDPNEIRKEFQGAKVRVGPFKIPCHSGPLLVQAIWEELLRRFRQYGALDAAQFERFYREGFQRGYRQFFEARASRSGEGEAASTRPGGVG